MSMDCEGDNWPRSENNELPESEAFFLVTPPARAPSTFAVAGLLGAGAPDPPALGAGDLALGEPGGEGSGVPEEGVLAADRGEGASAGGAVDRGIGAGFGGEEGLAGAAGAMGGGVAAGCECVGIWGG